MYIKNMRIKWYGVLLLSAICMVLGTILIPSAPESRRTFIGDVTRDIKDFLRPAKFDAVRTAQELQEKVGTLWMVLSQPVQFSELPIIEVTMSELLELRAKLKGYEQQLTILSDIDSMLETCAMRINNLLQQAWSRMKQESVADEAEETLSA